MNKDFNSKEERYNTIRKLCKMDLKHRRRLDRIHDIVESNQDILRGLEPTFVYESLSIDEMRETILDLFFIPKDNSDENIPKEEWFCREYYDDIWSSYVEDSSEEIDDDTIDNYIDSYIDVMEGEVMELDINTLYGKGKKRRNNGSK